MSMDNKELLQNHAEYVLTSLIDYKEKYNNGKNMNAVRRDIDFMWRGKKGFLLDVVNFSDREISYFMNVIAITTMTCFINMLFNDLTLDDVLDDLNNNIDKTYKDIINLNVELNLFS